MARKVRNADVEMLPDGANGKSNGNGHRNGVALEVESVHRQP